MGNWSRRAVSALGLVLAVGVPLACSERSGDRAQARGAGPLSVVASFYPLAEVAQAVGGDLAVVTNLTPPGQEPHDLQLQARQVQAIQQADVVVLLGKGFQPQVEEAVERAPKSVTRLDALGSVELLTVDAQLEGTVGEVEGEAVDGDVDPHVWLDPARMEKITDAVRASLAGADPANAARYAANADRYLVQLRALDAEFRDGLARCSSNVIVTSHRAFGYLARAYGLRQIPIAGISPDVEPDPKSLEAVAAEAKREGVGTIYLETIAPPELARTVAREIGAKVDLLDPVEGLSDSQLKAGATYLSVMRDNLGRLASGLGCTS